MTAIDPKTLQAYVEKLKPSLAGKFFYYCLPYRRAVVLNNMRLVFGDSLNETQIIHLAKAFYSHFAKSLWENICMRFMSEDEISAKAEVRGTDYVDAIEKDKQGVLILTGHFGNWEFAPIAGILNFKEFKGRFHFIRRTLKAKWLEKILFRRYFRAGLKVIPKKNSLNTVCDALADNDAVVYIMDQYASKYSKDSMEVEFFGKPVGTFRGLAMIANYMNLPVVPAASYRLPNGKHVLEFFPAIPWESGDNRKEELAKNIRAYNAALEEIICRHPEQWLWFHKRWKECL